MNIKCSLCMKLFPLDYIHKLMNRFDLNLECSFCLNLLPQELHAVTGRILEKFGFVRVFDCFVLISVNIFQINATKKNNKNN